MSSVLKKRRKKMRKHKYKKLRRRQKFLTSKKLGSHEKGKEGFVPEGKKVRIRVRTANCIYVGDFLIPPMRNRVSDAINEEHGYLSA